VLALIADGHFSPGEPHLFRPLTDGIAWHDPYMLCADYRAYLEAQERVDAAYRDPERWSRMAVLNVARTGKFSSDRAIAEYARDIWKVEPVTIELEG
jgi:glycogen phosphorylase